MQKPGFPPHPKSEIFPVKWLLNRAEPYRKQRWSHDGNYRSANREPALQPTESNLKKRRMLILISTENNLFCTNNGILCFEVYENRNNKNAIFTYKLTQRK